MDGGCTLANGSGKELIFWGAILLPVVLFRILVLAGEVQSTHHRYAPVVLHV